MSHNGDNGRFTGNPETQGNETTEEEDPIERAFAAANGIDGVTMGEQTPMPAQTGEFAASPLSKSQYEVEKTILATRKKAQLEEKLRKITEELEATEQEAARELFAGSWGAPRPAPSAPKKALGDKPKEGDDSDQEVEEPDCAESIDYLLQEFGEAEDLSMNRDTLHRMFAKVQLVKLQPKLNEHLGRRNKIGSMYVLMEEVRRVFKEEVEQFKKDLKRRTHALREKVQDFQTLLMVETKMRPVVASLVVAKIWSECSEASISQPIRDVAQAMCRSDLHGWKKIKENCAAGEIDQDLLTDGPVIGLEGFEEMICGDSVRMDKSWVKLIINTAVLMSYESVVKQTWRQALDGWTINSPSHDLCQKSGETVNDLLAKLRGAEIKLQKELRRLGKLDKLPDEEAMVKQHMLALYSNTRNKMVDLMIQDGTRKEDLTLKEAIKLMRKSEERLSINGYDFDGTRPPPAPTNERWDQRRQNDAAGKGAGKGGGKGKDQRTPEQKAKAEGYIKRDRAKAAYAKANSVQVADVSTAMVEKLGEDHWAGKFVKSEGKFGVRKAAGVHPVSGAAAEADNRTQQQKEDAMLNGEKPKPRPKPSMHHIQMGAGWKKRLSSNGTTMQFVAVRAAETDGEDRLFGAMDKYNNKYKKLSWLRKWSSSAKTSIAQRWMDAWLGKRKAPETEMPQRMEVPQKSGAGGEDDPHQQVYENEDFYEAGGDEAGDSDAPEDSPIYNADFRKPIETCRCQGLEGEHGCEAAATRNGLCDLCILGCLPGGV